MSLELTVTVLSDYVMLPAFDLSILILSTTKTGREGESVGHVSASVMRLKEEMYVGPLSGG